MKISELLLELMEVYIKKGDKNIEICRFSDEGRKNYWATSAVEKDNVFVISYHVEKHKRK